MLVRATRYPRLLGPTGGCRLLIKEVLNKLAMGLIIQTLANDPLRSMDGETRHLTPQFGHGLVPLCLRLLAGSFDNTIRFLLGNRSRFGLEPLSDLLRFQQEFLPLSPGTCEQLVALGISLRYLRAGLLCCCKALFNPAGPLVEQTDHRGVEKLGEQGYQDDKVDRMPEKRPAVNS